MSVGTEAIEQQWQPPENPTPEEVSRAATLIGMLDRMNAPMDATGWQQEGLEPAEVLDRMSLLSHQATIPQSFRQEARRRAQAVLDRAGALGRLGEKPMALRRKLAEFTAQGIPVRNSNSRAGLVNPDGSTFAGVGSEILYDAEDGTIVGTDLWNAESHCLWVFSADGTTFSVDGTPVSRASR